MGIQSSLFDCHHMGFHLVKRDFTFPSLMIELGDLNGTKGFRIYQIGEQADRLLTTPTRYSINRSLRFTEIFP